MSKSLNCEGIFERMTRCNGVKMIELKMILELMEDSQIIVPQMGEKRTADQCQERFVYRWSLFFGTLAKETVGENLPFSDTRCIEAHVEKCIITIYP